MASSVTVQGGVALPQTPKAKAPTSGAPRAAAPKAAPKVAHAWWSDRRVWIGALGAAALSVAGAWALWPSATGEAVVDREDLASACEKKKDAAACMSLGERAWSALDGARDLAAVERAFQAACDAGEPRGCVRLAHLYEDAAAFEPKRGTAQELRKRAAAAYEKPCEAQDPFACLMLASLTITGKGVQKSTPRATQLYTQARPLLEAQCADAATPAATRRRNCAAASLMQWRGLGGPKDSARSFEMLEQACALGDVGSCMLGGTLYAEGPGVREATADLAKAPPQLKKACELGDARGCHALAKILRPNAGPSVAEIVALETKACDAGVAAGCQEVGQMTFSGEGGPSDPKKAKEWFLREATLRQKACDAGVGDECVELAANYRSRGQGVPIDPSKAKELEDKAMAAWTAGCDAGVWSECLALRTRLEKEPTPDLKRVRALRERECALGYEHTCRRLGIGYPPPRP